MQVRYTKSLAELRRAQAFLDSHLDRFGSLSAGGARRALDDAVDELARQAQLQATHQTGRRGELANERRLARTLRREHIAPIVRVSQLMVPDVAQLEAIRLPRDGSNKTELVTQALALADAVQPYEGELRRGGLTGDFIGELRKVADRVLGAVGGKGAHRRQHIGATSAIDKTAIAMRRVVTAVDALARAAMPEDDPLVKEWASVVRAVRRAANRAITIGKAGDTADAPVGSAQGPVTVQPASATPANPAPASEPVRLAA